MSASLKPLTVQRLAYVRYLYQEGIEQSRQPSPLRARAITSFHDAIENFIGLTAEQLGVELKPRIEFLQYWEALKPAIELPGKTEMKRLNDARIALKHNGTFPSDHQIEQAREALVDFFSTVTPKVFGVDFDSVDMTDLVTQPEVTQYLREAQTHADIGDYPMAAAGLSLAFAALLSLYSVDRRRREGGPFSFGPTLDPFDKPPVGLIDGVPHNGRIDKLSRIAEALQNALRTMGLGIDYQDLARFQLLVPTVHGFGMGRLRFSETESLRQLTEEDYDWARHFVIESALQADRSSGLADLGRARLDADRRTHDLTQTRSWEGPAEPSGG
ncbi:hypothetical protein JHN63_01955 [Streptomyces sp. MBT65]|uniref:hypothetical protein n=1 Tax=Streptomyces sp. MBT65 TaxID=1488395 RepID=UPI00190C9824|nr:hypothetical protein [Streptomyces sp. MBT65]MBK3572606.1 hypothetical protein [Streptomyces sp. MBT65]